MSREEELTLVYLRPLKGRATVSHIRARGSKEHTECGLWKPGELWGTGSFEEYQIALSLPACRKCAAKTGIFLPKDEPEARFLGCA